MNLASRWFSVWMLSFLIIIAASACASAKPMKVEAAQTVLLDAWQTDQHIVWELDWPNAPVGGPLTVATWRAGPRYRLEILEAAAPDLVGQTLIFDGAKAWRSRRFDSPPAAPQPTEAQLSPVTDAFAVITRLLATTPASAIEEAAQFEREPAKKITLTFTGGDTLTLWRDETTGLPVRLSFVSGRQQATLRARSFERLSTPAEGLFEP